MKFADIIKYEGDNSTFVWKHPIEDFTTKTQLIVHESQEAVFFANGQALDVFPAGRYTLETQNFPFLQTLINIPTDGKTPFHCEVYFVNKVDQMSIKWGTDSRIEYLEPTYNFPLSIGANGELSLRVKDSRKFLLRLVGTENYLGRDRLTAFFRSFLNTHLKTYIAREMRERAINIFQIDEYLDSFSETLWHQLVPDFADYGISLEKFFITSVSKPDGNRQYEKFKELYFRRYADITEAKLRQETDIIYAQTEAQKVVIDSKAQATKREQEGYTYSQERSFDVAEKAVQNEAIGQMTNLGIGVGTMVGVGGVVSDVVGQAIGDIATPTKISNTPACCEYCGAKLADGIVFCEECGVSVAKSACANCGYVFERPGKFCPKCGASREV